MPRHDQRSITTDHKLLVLYIPGWTPVKFLVPLAILVYDSCMQWLAVACSWKMPAEGVKSQINVSFTSIEYGDVVTGTTYTATVLHFAGAHKPLLRVAGSGNTAAHRTFHAEVTLTRYDVPTAGHPAAKQPTQTPSRPQLTLLNQVGASTIFRGTMLHNSAECAQFLRGCNVHLQRCCLTHQCRRI